MIISKNNILKKLSIIGGIVFSIMLKSNMCFATSIGTAEVKQATDNITRAITSIAMPLGRCNNFCKYCYSSN